MEPQENPYESPKSSLGDGLMPPRGKDKAIGFVELIVFLHLLVVGWFVAAIFTGFVDGSWGVPKILQQTVMMVTLVLPLLICPLLMIAAVTFGRLTLEQRVGGILVEAVLCCLHFLLIVPMF